jgi:hypothetical protein
MAKSSSFEEVCEAMGGEYSEEEGDVSDILEVPEGTEARKQWCDLSKLENAPKGLTVFRTRGYVELQSDLFEPTAHPELEQGMFLTDLDPEEQKMCFTSTVPTFSRDTFSGAIKFCVTAYPRDEPRAVWVGFPTWHAFEVKPRMAMFQKRKK